MSDYLVFNVCVERLFGEAPSGVDIWHGSTIDDLIGQLPFKEEMLSNINAESDVVSFSETFTWMFGEDHLKKFSDFTKGTGLLSGSRSTESKTTEAKLVAALKYIFAVESMLTGLIGEDMVYAVDLPYLAETVSDFRCSVVLIESNYYKQALQNLRAALEVSVAHAYFGLQRMDFTQLNEDPDFRMPRFSSKRGMLAFLVNEGLLSSSEADGLKNIYADLSGAVHSEIRSLNVLETTIGAEREQAWCEYTSKVGDAVIKITLRLLKRGV